MTDPYAGREQTKAKHYILRHYLQELAFKVLRFSDIAYVDGFSGPWESKTGDFADSSFMIAISVLCDAQRLVGEQTGKRRRICCFFSESNRTAFDQLAAAVAPFHRPEEQFEIKTFLGRFEDAVGDIESFVGNSFPLIFIDPTGWTGYPFEKIKRLFARAKCEVLINFMYEFVNRFSNSDDEETVASLDPILGGPGWREKLDMSLPRGLAVEKLFRETLKSVCGFDFVVSTRIDKSTAERPHFFIAYGTKSREGLKAFRKTEFAALRAHEKNRANARQRKREERTRVGDMFAAYETAVQEESIDDLVDRHKAMAKRELVKMLEQRGEMQFSRVVTALLQGHMLRETNVRDICVELSNAGVIENNWGTGNRKPRDTNVIRLRAPGQ